MRATALVAEVAHLIVKFQQEASFKAHVENLAIRLSAELTFLGILTGAVVPSTPCVYLSLEGLLMG